MSLRVTGIQRGSVNDGPGVRTVVFLKGCSLRCPWCCNPETQLMEHQAYINDDKCLLYKKCPSSLCNDCVRVGGNKDLSKCVFGVYEEVAKDYELSQLLDEIINDEKLFGETGGGVTFSGGEPMLQAESLLPLLKILKNKGIQIAIETALVAPTLCFDMIKNWVNYWIIDLKLQPEMKLFDGEYKEIMRDRLNQISLKDKLFRIVYVNSMNSYYLTINQILNEYKIKDIELLQAHHLGKKKYQKLNMPDVDFTASIDSFNSFAEHLSIAGIKITKLTI